MDITELFDNLEWEKLVAIIDDELAGFEITEEFTDNMVEINKHYINNNFQVGIYRHFFFPKSEDDITFKIMDRMNRLHILFFNKTGGLYNYVYESSVDIQLLELIIQSDIMKKITEQLLVIIPRKYCLMSDNINYYSIKAMEQSEIMEYFLNYIYRNMSVSDDLIELLEGN